MTFYRHGLCYQRFDAVGFACAFQVELALNACFEMNMNDDVFMSDPFLSLDVDLDDVSGTSAPHSVGLFSVADVKLGRLVGHNRS